MSEQYPAAALVTDEIFDRITRESAYLHARRGEMQETSRELRKQEGEVKKQLARLEQCKQDLRGRTAEILALDDAATKEARVLAHREREVASREEAVYRREDEVQAVEQEVKVAKKELMRVIDMYNTQLDVYSKLEEKHQKTRELYGRLEVDHRLLKMQSARQEKEIERLKANLRVEGEKNIDLTSENATLAEQSAYYKKELSSHRSSPLTGVSPTLSVATTSKVPSASRKVSERLPSTPGYLGSTAASQARSSLSPPDFSSSANARNQKIRGPRYDGFSTSFETASPAVRLPSRPASAIDGTLKPSPSSSDDGDVSPLLLPGVAPFFTDRQQRRQKMLGAVKKHDPYLETPIAAAARDRHLAEQAAFKLSRSSRSSIGSKSVPSLQQQLGPVTPEQRSSSTSLDDDSDPSAWFKNVNHAVDAGSPPLSADETTPKASQVQSQSLTMTAEEGQQSVNACSPYQKVKVEDLPDSSTFLEDTLISEGIEIPDLGLSDLGPIRQSTCGIGTQKPQPPMLGSPIDIGKMTEGRVATLVAEKETKSNSQPGTQGKRKGGTDFKIQSKAFL